MKSSKYSENPKSSCRKDTIKYAKVSESTSNLEISLLSAVRLDSNPTYTNKNDNKSTKDNKKARQLDRNKSIDTMLASASEQDEISKHSKVKIRRNSSLISFKSLDISLKSIYTSLKGHKGSADKGRTESAPSQKATCILRAPYLKVETVENDESQKLLLTYAQSPGGSQHRRSFDTTSSQYLSTQTNYQELSQSPHGSSPYLSVSTGNIRRSSTSDILGSSNNSRKASVQQSSCGSVLENRKPSTSDMLRKARERKGSEGKIGRSISQGGIARGALRNRRISMAY